MLVPKYKLRLAPKAFQDYVEHYFEPIKFLREEYFYAFLVLILDQRKLNEKGVAPIHSCSLKKFKDGLPDKASLHNWMHENNDGEYFQRFNKSWDDGCNGPVVYCD